MLLAVACGELSRTPGAVDAGSTGTRLTCSSCDDPSLASCVSAECATRCDNATPFTCGDGSRCFEGACQRDVIDSCDDYPCNVNQECVSTYCLEKALGTCDPDAPRGCGLTLLCEPHSGRCLDPPPCNRDLSCRVGDLGAVCNTYRPDGGLWLTPVSVHRCLIGYCRDDTHCPAGRTCQGIGAHFEGLGVCR